MNCRSRLRRIFPIRQRLADARRDAHAAEMETEFFRSRRPLVQRIVYELGQHDRQNHFIDIVQAVARGAK